MTNYTYSKISAANFNTSPATVARSATGSVYAVGDTTYTTPLNMTLVVGGSVVTSISSDTNGYFPDFTLLDRTSCVWKQNSVAFATVLTTTDPVPGPPGASGSTGSTGAQGVPGDVSTWKPTTFYPLNTPVTNPSGDLVKVTTAHTSTSSYDATKFSTPYDAAVQTLVNTPGSVTAVALSATYAQQWKATTAYAAGQPVVNPSGDTVTAKVAFTSGATYSAANWNPSTTLAPISTTAKVVKWSTYGTNAAALSSAVAAAGAGGTVVVEKAKGPFTIDSAVTLTEVSLIGDGALINANALGSGIAALTFTSTGALPDMIASGFHIKGAGTRSLGVKNANVDGIQITGSAMPKFRDLFVENFDSGFVLNNGAGHIYWDHCNVTNNYYGVYCKLNTYDYFFTDCKINGNTFANFATSADQGYAGMVLTNCHVGFAPYGIYQEATPANQGKPKIFLQEVLLKHCRFEQIGNAAIFTAAQQDATNASITSNLMIEHPGFSWSPTYGNAGSYQLNGIDRNYAVVLSQTDRLIDIIQGANPFIAGTLNGIRIKLAGHAALIQRGGPNEAKTSIVTVDSGTPNLYAYANPPAGAPVQSVSGGQWYSAPGTHTTGNRPNAYMTCIPFRVDQAHTFTDLACEITTAGSTGAVVRLGIYADSSGAPGTLVLDAGTIDATTTGMKSLTGLSMVLQPGWYYLAAAIQGAPTTLPVMRCFGPGQNILGLPIYTSGNTSLNSGAAWANSSVSGALPTPSGANIMTDTGLMVAIKA